MHLRPGSNAPRIIPTFSSDLSPSSRDSESTMIVMRVTESRASGVRRAWGGGVLASEAVQYVLDKGVRSRGRGELGIGWLRACLRHRWTARVGRPSSVPSRGCGWLSALAGGRRPSRSSSPRDGSEDLRCSLASSAMAPSNRCAAPPRGGAPRGDTPVYLCLLLEEQ